MYDLDALRAFAMLLGIVLHAAFPFLPWRSSGNPDDPLFDLLILFIHGFRMPLFFLLSGFFTAMLWDRRGFTGVILHRLKRIGLPLLVSVATVLPLIILCFIVGAELATQESWSNYDFAQDQSQNTDNEGFDFAHLWFLWHLLWLNATYLSVRKLLSPIVLLRCYKEQICKVMVILLPFVTLIPQLFMQEHTFGPDTSVRLIPDWYVLLYYFVFFLFGSTLFDIKTHTGIPIVRTIGRRCSFLTIIGLIIFPFGIFYTFIESVSWFWISIIQLIFTWTMVIGLIGLFKLLLSRERFSIRYYSDASYWMYLIHLPLVILAQGLITNWAIHESLKFFIICLSVTVVLLISYRFFVRYTFIGTLLNDVRTKSNDQKIKSKLGNFPTEL
tara:strand:+ start:3191 stop:4345 length:1155 start_codon:yes stop_codon:yes gene_type:complete